MLFQEIIGYLSSILFSLHFMTAIIITVTVDTVLCSSCLQVMLSLTHLIKKSPVCFRGPERLLVEHVLQADFPKVMTFPSF